MYSFIRSHIKSVVYLATNATFKPIHTYIQILPYARKSDQMEHLSQ